MTNKTSSKSSRPPRRPRGKATPITNLAFSEILIPEVLGGNSGLSVAHLNVLPTIFPWLRATAGSFSKYQLRKIVLTFIPAGSTTYTGQIVGGFSYDSFENQPTSFAHVAQLARHRIQTVHSRQSWSLDVKQLVNSVYPTISAADLLLLSRQERIAYLPAIFHLATTSPNTQTLGCVQITYSVDFSAPLFSSIPASVPFVWTTEPEDPAQSPPSFSSSGAD